MGDRDETQLAVGVRDGTDPSELVGGEWVTPDGREPDATVTYADPGWVWWARGRMGQAPTYDEARRAAERALRKEADRG